MSTANDGGIMPQVKTGAFFIIFIRFLFAKTEIDRSSPATATTVKL